VTFDACSICRTVDIDVISHIGFNLYVPKSFVRFVVLYSCLIGFLFLSLADEIKLLNSSTDKKTLEAHFKFSYTLGA